MSVHTALLYGFQCEANDGEEVIGDDYKGVKGLTISADMVQAKVEQEKADCEVGMDVETVWKEAGWEGDWYHAKIEEIYKDKGQVKVEYKRGAAGGWQRYITTTEEGNEANPSFFMYDKDTKIEWPTSSRLHEQRPIRTPDALGGGS